MQAKSTLRNRFYGFLLILLGVSIAYPEWAKLLRYMHTGYISFRYKFTAPVYGPEAAAWHFAFLLVALSFIASGLRFALSGEQHA